jgi:hypothetical protein
MYLKNTKTKSIGMCENDTRMLKTDIKIKPTEQAMECKYYGN